MNNRHIEVTLINGDRLNFGGLCEKLDYTDDKFCIFKHSTGAEELFLAAIPYSSIYCISNEPDSLLEEEEDA